MTADVSFGRIPDGAANWEFLDAPTPGKSNVAPSAIEEETARQSFAPHTFRIESLSPNPARQATHLRLHIVKTGSYTVRIFDVIGREIRREQHEFVHGGMEELSLPLTDLKSGIYFVRVEGLRTAKAVKMIVLQ